MVERGTRVRWKIRGVEKSREIPSSATFETRLVLGLIEKTYDFSPSTLDRREIRYRVRNKLRLELVEYEGFEITILRL